MNDTVTAFLILAACVAGIASGAACATAYWHRRRNTEADATWMRYVESERKRNNMRHDLEAAQIRINTLEGERDLAAYQLTQLAAVAQVATQQAQAGRGYILNENPLNRICPN